MPDGERQIVDGEKTSGPEKIVPGDGDQKSFQDALKGSSGELLNSIQGESMKSLEQVQPGRGITQDEHKAISENFKKDDRITPKNQADVRDAVMDAWRADKEKGEVPKSATPEEAAKLVDKYKEDAIKKVEEDRKRGSAMMSKIQELMQTPLGILDDRNRVDKPDPFAGAGRMDPAQPGPGDPRMNQQQRRPRK